MESVNVYAQWDQASQIQMEWWNQESFPEIDAFVTVHLSLEANPKLLSLASKLDRRDRCHILL